MIYKVLSIIMGKKVNSRHKAEDSVMALYFQLIVIIVFLMFIYWITGYGF